MSRSVVSGLGAAVKFCLVADWKGSSRRRKARCGSHGESCSGAAMLVLAGQSEVRQSRIVAFLWVVVSYAAVWRRLSALALYVLFRRVMAGSAMVLTVTAAGAM